MPSDWSDKFLDFKLTSDIFMPRARDSIAGSVKSGNYWNALVKAIPSGEIYDLADEWKALEEMVPHVSRAHEDYVSGKAR